MPAAPGTPELGGVPFTEAIDFFRQKLRLPTQAWTDIWNGMHSRAFVVAGATSDALLADFQESIAKAQRDGLILADFRKDFDAIVAKHGWEHRGGAAWRAKTIFETNMRSANAAGKWAQIQRVKEQRPYLRYVTVGDHRVRPEHRIWHGIVLRVDDAWWRTHFPPNGWGCRCSVQQLSDRDLKRFGYKLSPAAPPTKLVVKTVDTPGGPIGVRVPQGIDPGFAYNPGIAWQGDPLPTKLDDRGVWPSLDPPGTPKAFLPPLKPQPLPEGFTPQLPAGETATDAFRRVFGAADAVLKDPAGGAVSIGQALLDYINAKPDGRARFVTLLPSLIEDPAEIWIGFETLPGTGRVVVKRRYVKVFDLGGGRGVVFVAQFERGIFEAFNLVPKALRGINSERVRGGTRIYRDPEQLGP